MMRAESKTHRNLIKKGPMQTDPTEAGVPSTHDRGFTQAWDTVGAGALKPALERALLRGACGSAVKLSVSYVGHSAREKVFLFCF